MAFAKLFSNITESSLWSEPKEVRLLFVTMLAKADAAGFIEASLPGLARTANLSIEETESALEVLSSPDPYSKNPEHDGRRVVAVPGGWALLNYETYRNRRSDEERREYLREYMRDYRSRKQSVNKNVYDVNTCKHSLTGVNHSKPALTQAEAEAEAEAEKDVGRSPASECTAEAVPTSQKAKRVVLCDDDYLTQLQGMSCYSGIDVQQEYGKAQAWCLTNGKQLTRRRFVNWLNRCDRPMAATAPAPARQQSQPKTVWTLKQQLDAIQEQIKHIETHYAMQTPHGLQWDMMATEDVKQQYAELRQKRKQLKEQITAA